MDVSSLWFDPGESERESVLEEEIAVLREQLDVARGNYTAELQKSSEYQEDNADLALQVAELRNRLEQQTFEHSNAHAHAEQEKRLAMLGAELERQRILAEERAEDAQEYRLASNLWVHVAVCANGTLAVRYNERTIVLKWNATLLRPLLLEVRNAFGKYCRFPLRFTVCLVV